MTAYDEDPIEIRTWPELTRSVLNSQGVFPTTIATLRTLEGAGRTGPKLLELIEKRLADLGLDHFPSELPVRADERVILYQRGSDVGELVRAVREDGMGSAGDAFIAIGRKLNRVASAGPVVSKHALRAAFGDVADLLEGGDDIV